MGDPLTVGELRRQLDAEGVDPAAYSLEGSHGRNGYVLAHGPVRSVPGGVIDTWSVFAAERGEELDRQDFTTEDEACRCLLHLLTRG